MLTAPGQVFAPTSGSQWQEGKYCQCAMRVVGVLAAQSKPLRIESSQPSLEVSIHASHQFLRGCKLPDLWGDICVNLKVQGHPHNSFGY